MVLCNKLCCRIQVYCLCSSPESLEWMYINLPLVTRSLFGPLRFYLHFCFTVNTPRWLCSHWRCEVFVSHFPESHSWTHDSSMCNGLSLLCRCEVRMMMQWNWVLNQILVLCQKTNQQQFNTPFQHSFHKNCGPFTPKSIIQPRQ